MSGFRLELREKHRLEHEIAQLFAERPVVVAVDGLEDFIRLFDHERLEGVDGLLAIPRTAVRRAKRRHDVNETRELQGGGEL